VEKFHLRGLERRYPAQLSGGQQQRAALARIMAGNPSILMLDEPLSALDSWLRWQLEGELLQMLEEFEGTTLYVSHNRDEVYRLCKKVCVMDRGRCEGACSVKELFESPNTLASAVLSGCKNYSRAEKAAGGPGCDDGSVYAVDWGVNLVCGAVPDDIGYVGVRARHIALHPGAPSGEAGGEGRNVFPCRVLRVIQDVFSTIVNIQPLNASGGDFSRIRAELPKQEGRFEEGDVVSAEIKPENVMLLKR
jgi:molybdate transport system ATP-binding protein